MFGERERKKSVLLGEWLTGFCHDAGNFLTPLGINARRMHEKIGSEHAKVIVERTEAVENWVNRLRNEIAQTRVVVAGALKEKKEAVYEQKMVEIGSRFGSRIGEVSEHVEEIRKNLKALEKVKEFEKNRVSMNESLTAFEKLVADARGIERRESSKARDVHEAVLLFTHPNDRKKIFFNGKNYSIHCEQYDLMRVLRNLYKNAFEAGASKVFVKAVEEGGRVVLRVSDDGKGIPEELADKVFNPFFSTKEDGLGIGLVVVRKMLERNNGSIELEKKVGEGTAFVLSFRKEG